MAVEMTYRSDLSGNLIAGDPVQVKIHENGHVRTLDLSQTEVTELFGNLGRIEKQRGRKAKTV